MADDTDGEENPEKSESWEDLPESIKKDNARIAANAEGDSEDIDESLVEQLSSDDGNGDDDSADDK